MISFKDYVVLKEGGATFAKVLGDDIIRIPRGAVPQMMQAVVSKLATGPFQDQHFRGVGSVEPDTFTRTAKTKQDFGDLDIAVDISVIPEDGQEALVYLSNHVKKYIKPKDQHIHVNKGLNVVSFAYPVPNMPGKFGQVDLMPAKDHKFNTDFAYTVRSKNNEVYSRNALAQKIVAELTASIGNMYKSIDGRVISKAELDQHESFYEYRFFFSTYRGLAHGKRFRKWKRDKSGTSAKPYELIGQPKTNIDLIMVILFGPEQADPSITATKEQMVDYISTKGSHATFQSLHENWPETDTAEEGILNLEFEPYSRERIEFLSAVV